MTTTVARSEWASTRLLDAACRRRSGEPLPTPSETLATTAEEARRFAAEHGRVVAKASGVAHKSEAGLVRVGLDEDDLDGAFAELAAAGDGSVLVAEQVVDAELELLVGGSRDPVFGAIVSVGLGGIATELVADAAFLLAPPEPGELDRALAQLRGERLLDGVRGRPGVDREELTRIVAAVADVLLDDDRVVEIDCNPVMVVHGRPLVVDALVVVAADDAGHPPTARTGAPA